MVSRLGRFAALAVFVSSFSSATHALSENPVDPSLPLAIHAFTSCNFGTPVNGNELASCLAQQSVENPTTLYSVTGTGEATADLRSGTLKSRSEAQAYKFATNDLKANASANAMLYDTITIGGGFSGVVQMRMEISGAFRINDPNAAVSDPFVGAILQGLDGNGNLFGSAAVQAHQYTSGGGIFLTPPTVFGNVDIETNADHLNTFPDPADVRFAIGMNILVTPSTPSFTFIAGLDTASGFGFILPGNETKVSELDFGNTARLSLIVPDGVSWTSASRAFLVPEPGTYVLVLTGLLTLLLALRRTRRPS